MKKKLSKQDKNKEITKLFEQLKDVTWDMTLKAMKDNPNGKEDVIGLEMVDIIKKQIAKGHREEF